jgi:hypothetical protein
MSTSIQRDTLLKESPLTSTPPMPPTLRKYWYLDSCVSSSPSMPSPSRYAARTEKREKNHLTKKAHATFNVVERRANEILNRLAMVATVVMFRTEVTIVLRILRPASTAPTPAGLSLRTCHSSASPLQNFLLHVATLPPDFQLLPAGSPSSARFSSSSRTPAHASVAVSTAMQNILHSGSKARCQRPLGLRRESPC